VRALIVYHLARFRVGGQFTRLSDGFCNYTPGLPINQTDHCREVHAQRSFHAPAMKRRSHGYIATVRPDRPNQGCSHPYRFTTNFNAAALQQSVNRCDAGPHESKHQNTRFKLCRQTRHRLGRRHHTSSHPRPYNPPCDKPFVDFAPKNGQSHRAVAPV